MNPVVTTFLIANMGMIGYYAFLYLTVPPRMLTVDGADSAAWDLTRNFVEMNSNGVVGQLGKALLLALESHVGGTGIVRPHSSLLPVTIMHRVQSYFLFTIMLLSYAVTAQTVLISKDAAEVEEEFIPPMTGIKVLYTAMIAGTGCLRLQSEFSDVTMAVEDSRYLAVSWLFFIGTVVVGLYDASVALFSVVQQEEKRQLVKAASSAPGEGLAA